MVPGTQILDVTIRGAGFSDVAGFVADVTGVYADRDVFYWLEEEDEREGSF